MVLGTGTYTEKQGIIIIILKGSRYEKIRGVWKIVNAWLLACIVVIDVLLSPKLKTCVSVSAPLQLIE
jgi:hypothetical protein